MFTRLAPERDSLADLCRVETLGRERFRIGASELTLVSQDREFRPGFPLLETNVLFWKDHKRYRLKIFQPVAMITETDLPAGWLLPALEDIGEADCC